MSGSKCGLPGSARRLTEKSPARHPPPHQPSPAGSASATPPRGGQPQGLCRCAGGQGGGYWLAPPPHQPSPAARLLRLPLKGGVILERLMQASRSLPPGGGVGETRAKPAVEPEGGTRCPVSDDQRHYRRQGGGNWLAPPPHQPSPAARLLRLPLKGGVILERLLQASRSLPPGGGVGERAEPAVEPEGGDAAPCE